MRDSMLYGIWAGLYVLCAGLGFIPEPQGFLAWFMTALSLVFFIPGWVLLSRGIRQKRRDPVKLIRNLSALSLSVTALVLAGNILSALASDAVGTALYVILGIVSSPMLCSRIYALSLFCWACLLITSQKELKQ